MSDMSRYNSAQQQQRRAQRRMLAEQRVRDHGDDQEVLTFSEWCALNAISERQGQRILKGSDRPVVTMIGSRRIGITRANNRRWQASRSK